MNVGKLESSGRPETSAATTTTMELLKGDTDRSGQIFTQSTNLFPKYAPNMGAYTTVQDAINNISSSSVGEQAAMEPKTPQMTIFYAGQVFVFDDFSAAKAKEVMLLASKGFSTTNINKIVDNCGNPCPHPHTIFPILDLFKLNQPQSQPIGSDLPIARRASLHRFLEKRKDRATARAPYQLHNPPPESPKEQFDLNV